VGKPLSRIVASEKRRVVAKGVPRRGESPTCGAFTSAAWSGKDDAPASSFGKSRMYQYRSGFVSVSGDGG
jgi:hypothetical protein